MPSIRTLFVLVLGAGLPFAWAQQQPLPQPLAPPQAPPAIREFNERLKEAGLAERENASRSYPDYKIGPEDLLEVSVFEVAELSRSVRVSASGEVSLPLLGVVRVRGLSALETERLLTELLRQKYMKDPQVTVFVREYRSDPISVLGAVRNPNIYYIQTQKTLLEVLAMAGGFSETIRTPGRTIQVVRRSVRAEAGWAAPAPSEAAGTPHQQQVIEVPIKALLQSGDSKWNIWIYPGDSVKVTLAGNIYVAGNVVRPGAFPLTDFDNLSAVQALALAGGTSKAASRKNAAIIHMNEDGTRIERKIDLGRILRGQDPDTTLGPNDVLFVPGSVGREAAMRAVESSIQLGTGILIWRR
jgi:polysaccharide export outer membrane protein